jgi:hypothetical protein
MKVVEGHSALPIFPLFKEIKIPSGVKVLTSSMFSKKLVFFDEKYNTNYENDPQAKSLVA